MEKMQMNKNKKLVGDKGFTIIELIVVIAIIAVLAAIVLVNVTQYIAKSRNSAIKGNMASLMTNGAAYFDQNVTATGNAFELDTASGCAGPIASAISDAGGEDFDCIGSTTTQAWCAESNTLAAGSEAAGTWCVDSTGYKGEGTCSATNFVCE
jgi:prepilin-type N-terminal cleavage/methylation domain-containing protein